MVFHVLNRRVGRQPLFDEPAEYAAFEDIVKETLEKAPMRICGYCLMTNQSQCSPPFEAVQGEFLRRPLFAGLE